MIPMNATLKLVIGLVLIAGVGALNALLKVETAWTWIGTAVQTLTALEFFFTVPAAASANAASKRGFVSFVVLRTLALVAVVGVVARLLLGCAPGVTPSSAWQKLIADIKAGLAAHDTLPQLEAIITTDLGADMTPQADAILDGVLVVLEDGTELLGAVGANSYEADIHTQLRAKIAAASK